MLHINVYFLDAKNTGCFWKWRWECRRKCCHVGFCNMSAVHSNSRCTLEVRGSSWKFVEVVPPGQLTFTLLFRCTGWRPMLMCPEEYEISSNINGFSMVVLSPKALMRCRHLGEWWCCLLPCSKRYQGNAEGETYQCNELFSTTV